MSIIATAVKHLMAAGVTGDALIAAIADMEANMPTPVDAVAEKRRAYDRERKRNERMSGGNPVDSADKAETTPFPAPPNENNLTPPTHTPVYKTPRARRLPVDWIPAPLPSQLLDQVSAWKAGLLESELAKFRDWAASAPDKTGMKKDWDAAWRNWLRRKNEEGPKNGNAGQSDGMGRTERAAIQALRDLGHAPSETCTSQGGGGTLPATRGHAAIGGKSGALLAIGYERGGSG